MKKIVSFLIVFAIMSTMTITCAFAENEDFMEKWGDYFAYFNPDYRAEVEAQQQQQNGGTSDFQEILEALKEEKFDKAISLIRELEAEKFPLSYKGKCTGSESGRIVTIEDVKLTFQDRILPENYDVDYNAAAHFSNIAPKDSKEVIVKISFSITNDSKESIKINGLVDGLLITLNYGDGFSFSNSKDNCVIEDGKTSYLIYSGGRRGTGQDIYVSSMSSIDINAYFLCPKVIRTNLDEPLSVTFGGDRAISEAFTFVFR